MRTSITSGAPQALSAAVGWHEAKTSRIESAKQALSDADIQTWCRVCGAERDAPDLIAASRAADSMYVDWRRLTRTGLRRTQEARRPLYERTRLFKVYCSTVVPGFLQTPAYATALLSANSSFHSTPDDVEDAVRARMSRNRIVQSAGHRFAMLMEEAVLRYRLGDADTMAGQLGIATLISPLASARCSHVADTPAAALRRKMATRHITKGSPR